MFDKVLNTSRKETVQVAGKFEHSTAFYNQLKIFHYW